MGQLLTALYILGVAIQQVEHLAAAGKAVLLNCMTLDAPMKQSLALTCLKWEDQCAPGCSYNAFSTREAELGHTAAGCGFGQQPAHHQSRLQQARLDAHTWRAHSDLWILAQVCTKPAAGCALWPRSVLLNSINALTTFQHGIWLSMPARNAMHCCTHHCIATYANCALQFPVCASTQHSGAGGHQLQLPVLLCVCCAQGRALWHCHQVCASYLFAPYLCQAHLADCR